MKNGSTRSLAGAVGQRVVLAVAIAVSVVVIGGWTGRRGHPSEVTVLRGTATTVNAPGTAIGFEGQRVGGPQLRIGDVDGSWIVAGATWFDGRTWHDNDTPTCLSDGGLPQPVDFGVVEAAPHDDAPGRAMVVWLKCFGAPLGGPVGPRQGRTLPPSAPRAGPPSDDCLQQSRVLSRSAGSGPSPTVRRSSSAIHSPLARNTRSPATMSWSVSTPATLPPRVVTCATRRPVRKVAPARHRVIHSLATGPASQPRVPCSGN